MKSSTYSNSKVTSYKILIETVIVMLITLSSAFVSNVVLKYILETPAFLYLLIELKARHRSLRDLGFKLSQTPKDLQNNLFLLFVVTTVLQITPLFIGKAFIPEYIEHLKDRMPSTLLNFSLKSIIILFVVFIVTSIICLYEEIIYRGFFTERLSWYMKPSIAIIISTILFTCMHFTPGNSAAALFDLTFIILDGIIYSIIYIRTRNIYASFVAHMMADIFGILVFRLMF
jgi:membrane protease YdiL (CAAX protease family)